MGRPRLEKNKGLPAGMRRRGPRYTYVCQITGIEYGLGRVRRIAFERYRQIITGTPDFKYPEGMLSVEQILAAATPRAEVTGVYVLLLGDEVMYVGQSIAIHGRIADHAKKEVIQFDRFSIIPCKSELLDVTEAAYIALLSPKMNKNQMLTALRKNSSAITESIRRRKGEIRQAIESLSEEMFR